MSKKYHIEYLPVAQKDLIEIFQYILADSPSAAAELLDQIDKSVSKLEDFPSMGMAAKDPRLMYLGYRILVVDNYLVFYVVLDNEVIEIRSIIHGKKKYDFLL